MWRTAAVLIGVACLVGLPARSTRAQSLPPTPNARLCGEDPDDKPRILIGRFSLFGDFDPAMVRTIEPAFAGSLVLGLLSRSDRPVGIYLWGRDAVDLREFKQSATLIEDAFLGGAARDKTGERERQDLTATLRANGCSLLFGGRLSKDGDMITVSPHLFDVGTGQISQPFPAVVVSRQSLSRVPESFAEQLAAYLQKALGGPSASKNITLRCLSYQGGSSAARDREVELLAAALHRRLVQQLAGRNLAVSAPTDAGSICRDQASAVDPASAATISGELLIREDRLELRPVVSIPSTNPGVSTITIHLATLDQSLSSTSRLAEQFSGAMASFLTAVTKRDGSFVDLAATGKPEELPALLRPTASAGTADGKNELRALGAYIELSTDPTSAIANYVLGKELAAKAEIELALKHLMAAAQSGEGLSPEARADLMATIGAADVELKQPETAVEYLEKAKAGYAALSIDAAVARTVHELASVRYSLGDQEGARRELLNQKDVEADSEALYLLGRFAALSERNEEAADWLAKAIKVNPGNGSAKGLLADVYEIEGRRELRGKNYSDARRYFTLALGNREHARVRYLSGVAAYENGDYEDAISEFESVIAVPTDKATLRIVEGAWLNMLECLLLTKHYRDLDERAVDALTSVGAVAYAHRIIGYLRFVARVLDKPALTIAELAEDPNLRELKAGVAGGSTEKPGWDNRKIEGFINKQAELAADKRSLLDEATKALLR